MCAVVGCQVASKRPRATATPLPCPVRHTPRPPPAPVLQRRVSQLEGYPKAGVLGTSVLLNGQQLLDHDPLDRCGLVASRGDEQARPPAGPNGFEPHGQCLSARLVVESWMARLG